MKIKVVFSVVILFSVMAFIFTKPSKKENSESLTTTQLSGVNDSSFIIGAFGDGNDPNYSRLTDSLNFNFWFRYLRGFESNPPDYYIYPKGWTNDDRVMNMDSTPYLQSVRDILSNNAQAKMNTIMHRPKTEWLAFGQRSDYQCENVQNTDLWFYGYTYHPKGNDKTDTTSFGNGLKARLCKFGVDDMGYVVKGLIANREQINVNNIFSVPYPGFGDKQFDWYIKPRIRIDINDANPSISVCRIEVLDFDAKIIKNIIIKGDNFRDENNNNFYDGRYLDEFYGSIKDSLKIPGDRSEFPKNAFNPRGVDRDSTNCKVDFRVYWLGECDMWIDYVRVEDERAHDLFGDPNTNQKTQIYQQMLRLESKLAFDNNNTAYRFYTEEFQFNHLPCLKYVYDYIKQNSGVGASFYGSPGGVFYSDHTPNRQSLGREHYKKYFIDSIKPKELIYNAYPLFDGSQTDTKIPNTLPVTIGAGILATPVSPQSYDNWLQSFMDDNIKWPYGDFINILKDLQSLCKSTSNLNFFSSIQTHLHQGPDGHLREPTNEEIEMMVNTSVSYGSKGILYFWYDAWGTIPPNSLGCSRGLLDSSTTVGIYPRYINEYGQLKWQKIKDIDKKLKTWGPILMHLPIANTNSYVYRDRNDRTLLINNSCFSKFTALRPGNNSSECVVYDNSGMLADCQEITYLQVSTFGSIEPNSYYFMVVNRRCSPYKNDYNEESIGGRRNIRASLHSNYSAFSDFNNWNVVNCENDSIIATFNKSNPGYVNLDWFMPGEGKLYKIVPR